MMIHPVFDRALDVFADNEACVVFGMGCFWGAEKLFWSTKGVTLTSVGYIGGSESDATYGAVCQGTTNHVEAVRVHYDPQAISLGKLIRLFLENHDPTQENRQGNDRGSQYRSALFVSGQEELSVANRQLDQYHALVRKALGKSLKTQLHDLDAYTFYLAEAEHQQYLWHHPLGYCNLRGLGLQWLADEP